MTIAPLVECSTVPFSSRHAKATVGGSFAS